MTFSFCGFLAGFSFRGLFNVIICGISDFGAEELPSARCMVVLCPQQREREGERERESEFLSQQVYDGMLERERERREGGMVGWF